MSADDQGQRHWARIAALWEHVGPPLRPAGEELAHMQEAINAWARRTGGRPRGLVLGATAEFRSLDWLGGGPPLAADLSLPMLRALWPGREAIRADWTALPLASGSRDIILCDGGLAVLPYSEGQRWLLASLRRVLAPGGLAMFRVYVPPAKGEPTEAVLSDLVNGRVPNLSVLKLRLWMAMRRSAQEGVRLGDVWCAVQGAEPDFARLAARAGWAPEHLAAIHTYQGSDARYYFPTLAEIDGLIGEAGCGLELGRVITPSHEFGEWCPIVELRRSE